jgi:hypothetical protein
MFVGAGLGAIGGAAIGKIRRKQALLLSSKTTVECSGGTVIRKPSYVHKER